MGHIRRRTTTVLSRGKYLLVSLQAIVPLTTGHIHYHHHHHDHDDHGHAHSQKHTHNGHRRTNEIQSDYSTEEQGGQFADVFDSCVVACYKDMVDRYGAEFADQLKADGFTYENCEDDYTEGAVNNTVEDSPQQRALHRILGATNQLSRLWSKPEYRNTTTGLLEIPYKIKDAAEFTSETYTTIAKAIKHIEDSTGVIKFIPQSFESEYIYFNYESVYANVCAANMGKQVGTRTNVYLGWCKELRHVGNIVHELLHAMGFWHEHSRPDRDNHVTIDWKYVPDNAMNNFQKATMVNSLGSPYDFNSIMHYPGTAFSNSTSSPKHSTILPVNALASWESMGQRAKLSVADVEQLRLLYQCASGPRDGGLTMDELCSEDCPCWEYALGSCASDAECMDDLVCADYYHTTGIPQEEHVDALPYQSTGRIYCDQYCNELCCDLSSNSKILCPVTCGSAPPQEALTVVPAKMCVKSENVVFRPPENTTSTTLATTSVATSSTMTTVVTTEVTETTVATTAYLTTAVATTEAPPTTTTTTATTTELSGVWYIDWYTDNHGSRCVKYCVGDPPCGGFKDHEALYLSVEECCGSPLMSYKEFSECSYEPQFLGTDAPTSSHPPTSTPTNGPTITAKPTTSVIPTSSPTTDPTSNAVWFVDWSISKCVQDCVGRKPCGSRRKDTWEAGYTTVQTCCSTHLSYRSFNECSNEPDGIVKNSANVGTASQNSDSSWYPATNGNTCLNDGNAPGWQKNKYSSQAACCAQHFNWDTAACMGITPQGTYKWYVSWSKGKCVKDCDESEGASCGGVETQSWVKKHNDVMACCSAHMSYDISRCKG